MHPAGYIADTNPVRGHLSVYSLYTTTVFY